MATITTLPPSRAAVPPVAAGGVQHDVPGGGAVPAAPLRVPAGAGTGAAPAEIINIQAAGASTWYARRRKYRARGGCTS